MRDILQRWTVKLRSVLTFYKAPKEMKLTRLIEKFDVVEISAAQVRHGSFD